MGTQNIIAPKANLGTIKAIDLELEAIYENGKPQNLGRLMVDVKLGSSQIRGLETLALSTRRFSEIINYIKNQAGKDRKNQWSKIVDEVLGQLYQLEKRAKEIGGEDPGLVLDVKIRLARGWAKQVVSHYLFQDSLKKDKQDAE